MITIISNIILINFGKLIGRNNLLNAEFNFPILIKYYFQTAPKQWIIYRESFHYSNTLIKHLFHFHVFLIIILIVNNNKEEE